jgi:hypothetical protein
VSRRRASYRPYEPISEKVVYLAEYGERRRRLRARRQERPAVRGIPEWVAPTWIGMLAGAAIVLLLAFGGSL